MGYNDFYIFLSSRDSNKSHPDNVLQDFQVELPERLLLEGDWEIALIDFYHNGNIAETIVVNCDLCDYSYIHNGYDQILRIIYPQSNKYIYFPIKLYQRIKVNNFQKIHIYIKDSNQLFPTLDGDEIKLTLHFRKIYQSVI